MLVAVLFLFTEICFFPSRAHATPKSSTTVQGGDSPAAFQSQPLNESGWLPPELGSIDEIYRPESGVRSPERFPAPGSRRSAAKTIVFIQDAHDSLEAQENIAKIIEYLVAHHGVRTVFEEGYEGPVPTDDYFGFIEDPELKRKVAYFFLDHLRIGGAEYAHINRATGDNRKAGSGKDSGQENPDAPRLTPAPDWQLIGADSLALHQANVDQYRLSAEKKEAIGRDLKALEKEIRALADARFPKGFREWLKLKDRFDAKKLDLFTYLSRTVALADSQKLHTRRPALHVEGLLRFILDAVKSNDPVVIGKAKHIDAREVFTELLRLERSIAEACLPEAVDRELYGHYRTLRLVERLNDLMVTQEEYAALRVSLEPGGKSPGQTSSPGSGFPAYFDTQSLGEFIHKHAKKPLVLSKQWERNIRDAVKFYEIAAERDGALSEALDRHFRKNPRTPHSKLPGSEPAILVYGGFHKENVKRILEARGIGYVVVSPGITKPSPRHEKIYRKLMTEGMLPFEQPVPPALGRASRPIPVTVLPNGREAIRRVCDALRFNPEADPETLGLVLGVQTRRGESRAPEKSDIQQTLDRDAKLQGIAEALKPVLKEKDARMATARQILDLAKALPAGSKLALEDLKAVSALQSVSDEKLRQIFDLAAEPSRAPPGQARDSRVPRRRMFVFAGAAALAGIAGAALFWSETKKTARVRSTVDALTSYYRENYPRFHIQPPMIVQPVNHVSKSWEGYRLELIAGPHGAPKAAEKILELAPLLAESPEKWQIVLEGGVNTLTRSGRLADVTVLIKLSDLLRIPVVDPVPTPSDPEVIREIEKRLSLTKDEVMAANLFDTLFFLAGEVGMSGKSSRQAWETFLTYRSMTCGVSKQEISRRILKKAGELEASPELRDRFAETINRVNAATHGIRNDVGRGRSLEMFGRNAGRRNILALVGSRHAPIYGENVNVRFTDAPFSVAQVDMILRFLQTVRPVNVNRPESREGSVTRRVFLTAGALGLAGAAITGMLAGRPAREYENPLMKHAELAGTYEDTAEGLVKLRVNSMPINQTPYPGVPDFAWIKPDDIGYMMIADLLMMIHAREYPVGGLAKPELAKGRILDALKMMERLVNDFELRVRVNGREIGTGVLPEVLVPRGDYFVPEQSDVPGQPGAKGIAYAFYNMGLTHERLKIIRDVFAGGIVEGIKDREISVLAAKLLARADYRPFIDAEKRIHAQVFKLSGTDEVVRGPLIVDNQHTEARFILSIADLLGTPGKSEDERYAEGLESWNTMWFKWRSFRVDGKEVLVADGDHVASLWTEGEGAQFFDPSEAAPLTWGRSFGNYGMILEDLKTRHGLTWTPATGLGTAQDPGVFSEFGIGNYPALPAVIVPAYQFVALTSGSAEAVAAASRFVEAAKKSGAYVPGWGLPDAVDPVTAKAFNGKILYINQGLTLEALNYPVLREIVRKTAWGQRALREFRAADAKRPAPRSELRKMTEKEQQAAAIEGLALIRGGKKGQDYSSDDEVLAIMDASGRLMEKGLPKKEVHARHLEHMTGHIYFFDPAGNLIFQKRSPRKSQSPGRLQVAVSGHINFGETPVRGTLREGFEESGITIDPASGRFYQISEVNQVYRPSANEHTTVFAYFLTPEEMEILRDNYNTEENELFCVMPFSVFEERLGKYPDAFSGSLHFLVEKHPELLTRLKDLVRDREGFTPLTQVSSVRSEMRGEDDEWIRISWGAIRMAEYIHDKGFKAILVSGDSADIPKELVDTAWERLYPGQGMPAWFLFDGRENKVLYRDWATARFFGEDSARAQSAFLEGAVRILDDKVSADGGTRLAAIKNEEIVFLDSRASIGTKISLLKEVFKKAGFPKVSYAVLTVDHIETVPILHPDLFVAVDEKQAAQNLRVLDISLSRGRKNDPSTPPYSLEQVRQILDAMKEDIRTAELPPRPEFRSRRSETRSVESPVPEKTDSAAATRELEPLRGHFMSTGEYMAAFEGTLRIGIGKDTAGRFVNFEVEPVTNENGAPSSLPTEAFFRIIFPGDDTEEYRIAIQDFEVVNDEAETAAAPEENPADKIKREAEEVSRQAFTYVVARERDDTLGITHGDLFEVADQYLSKGKHFTFQIFTIGDRTWFKVVDYSLNGTNISADIDPDTVVYPQRLEVLTTFDERLDEVSSKSLQVREAWTDKVEGGQAFERFKLMLDGAAQLYLESAEFPELREKRKKILATYFFPDSIGHSPLRAEYALNWLHRFKDDDRASVVTPVGELACKYAVRFRRFVELLPAEDEDGVPESLRKEAKKVRAELMGRTQPFFNPSNTMKLTTQALRDIDEMNKDPHPRPRVTFKRRSEMRSEGARPELTMDLQFTNDFYDRISGLDEAERESFMSQLHRTLTGIQETTSNTGVGKALKGLSGGYSEFTWRAALRVIFRYNIVSADEPGGAMRRKMTFFLYWDKKESSNNQKPLDDAIAASAGSGLVKDPARIRQMKQWLYGAGKAREPSVPEDFPFLEKNLEPLVLSYLQLVTDLKDITEFVTDNWNVRSRPGKPSLLQKAVRDMQEALTRATHEDTVNFAEAARYWLEQNGPAVPEVLEKGKKFLGYWFSVEMHLLAVVAASLPAGPVKNLEEIVFGLAALYFEIAGPAFRQGIQKKIEEWAEQQPPDRGGLYNLRMARVLIRKVNRIYRTGTPFESPRLQQLIKATAKNLRQATIKPAETAGPVAMPASPAKPLNHGILPVVQAPMTPGPAAFKLPDAPGIPSAVEKVKEFLRKQPGVSAKSIESNTEAVMALLLDPGVSNSEKQKGVPMLLPSFSRDRLAALKRAVEEATLPLIADRVPAASLVKLLKDLLQTASGAFANDDFDRVTELAELAANIREKRINVTDEALLIGQEELEKLFGQADAIGDEIDGIFDWFVTLLDREGQPRFLVEEDLRGMIRTWKALSERQRGAIRRMMLAEEIRDLFAAVPTRTKSIAAASIPFLVTIPHAGTGDLGFMIDYPELMREIPREEAFNILEVLVFASISMDYDPPQRQAPGALRAPSGNLRSESREAAESHVPVKMKASDVFYTKAVRDVLARLKTGAITELVMEQMAAEERIIAEVGIKNRFKGSRDRMFPDPLRIMVGHLKEESFYPAYRKEIADFLFAVGKEDTKLFHFALGVLIDNAVFRPGDAKTTAPEDLEKKLAGERSLDLLRSMLARASGKGPAAEAAFIGDVRATVLEEGRYGKETRQRIGEFLNARLFRETTVRGTFQGKSESRDVFHLREPAVFVIEQKTLVTMLRPEHKQWMDWLFGFAAINKGMLHIVIPDRDEAAESSWVKDLGKAASVHTGFGNIARAEHMPVFYFSRSDFDSAGKYIERLNERGMKVRAGSAVFVDTDGGRGFALAGLLGRKVEELPVVSGFHRDSAGRFRDKLAADLQSFLQSYVVITTSA